MFLTLLAVGVAAAFAAGAVAGEGKKNDKHFQYAIGLWGDLPYSDTQAQVGVPNLVDDMNNADIEFSVHDGDLKAGNAITGSVTPTTCQTAREPTIYSQGLGYFNALEKPAVFTPGDNDWTDCDRTSNGGFNDLFQLQYERNLFFSTDRSLGEHPMKMEVQSDKSCLGTNDPTGANTFMTACSENRRWRFKDVTYATLNVQGTCNNRCSSGTGDAAGDEAEYQAREKADEAWLDETFDQATTDNSAAVMVIWQADPGFDTAGFQGAPKRDPRTLVETDGNPDGFHDILSNLRARTIAFRRPVVLVHGDSHYFMIDKPLLDAQGRRVENFTRGETFGDHAFPAANKDWDTTDVNWVKVLVDPHGRDVFAFQPQIVPANRVAVPAP
ncbi:MAG TPA: hypothetical protein VFU10_00165 [Gaiellaceae bacterium]|nr:hypothetical protein [Gaiellaceae bacterium]